MVTAQAMQQIDGVLNGVQFITHPRFGFLHCDGTRYAEDVWVQEDGFVGPPTRTALRVPKPAGERRLFLLGSSPMLACAQQRYADTCQAHLERLLPGWTVVNAAVGGFFSAQELARLSQELVFLEPDAVAVVDGYNDYRQWEVGTRKPEDSHANLTALETRQWGIQEGHAVIPNSVDTLFLNWQMMGGIGFVRRFPIRFLLQPMRVHPENRLLAEYRATAAQRLRELFSMAPGAFHDATTLFDDHPERYFVDNAHYTALGNTILAEQLVRLLTSPMKEAP